MSIKDEIIAKVDRLVGKEVIIAGTIRFSPNHIDDYAAKKGILKNYDIGEDYEDIMVLVEVMVIKGKKSEIRDSVLIWVDAREVSGVKSNVKMA